DQPAAHPASRPAIATRAPTIPPVRPCRHGSANDAALRDLSQRTAAPNPTTRHSPASRPAWMILLLFFPVAAKILALPGNDFFQVGEIVERKTLVLEQM